jgi:uncharacterized membrane protein YdjX (TVP38/TMEM64 family)
MSVLEDAPSALPSRAPQAGRTPPGGRIVAAAWVGFALLGLVGALLAWGAFRMDWEQSAVAAFLQSLRGQWWAPAAVTATFTVLAFAGAPQVVLIAATVAVFGASEGMVLSWLATMISACVGYCLGRVAGPAALTGLFGGRQGKALAIIGKNGFLTSLMIRLVPSGPFILVNLALGAAKVRLSWFFGGTGIGIVPKIMLIAFGAQGVGQALQGENLPALLFFAAAGATWALIVFVARPMLRARAAADPLAPEAEAR